MNLLQRIKHFTKYIRWLTRPWGGKSLEKKLAKMSAEDLRTIVLVAVKIINDINSRMESGELQEL